MGWLRNLNLSKRFTILFILSIYVPLFIGIFLAFTTGEEVQKKLSLFIHKTKEDIELEKLKDQYQRFKAELAIIPTFTSVDDIADFIEKNPKKPFAKIIDNPFIKKNIKILENRFRIVLISNKNLWGISLNIAIGEELFNILAINQNQQNGAISVGKNLTIKNQIELIKAKKLLAQSPVNQIFFSEQSLLFPFDKTLSHPLDTIMGYRGIAKSPKKSNYAVSFYINPFREINEFENAKSLNKINPFKIVLKENLDRSLSTLDGNSQTLKSLQSFLKDLPPNFLAKDSAEIIDENLNILVIRKIKMDFFNISKFVIISYYPAKSFHSPINETKNALLKILSFLFILVIPFLYFILSRFSKELNEISDELKRTSDTLEKSIEVIHFSSGIIKKSNLENISHLNTISQEMNKMTLMSQTLKSEITEVNSLSSATNNSAKEGRNGLNELSSSMEKVIESSKNISKIIGIIENISLQTNILSMNASVEAARAGEHGKGFAVVADSIRNLSQKSAQSASEIRSFIQESIEISEFGEKKASSNRYKFTEIIENIEKLKNILDEFSSKINLNSGEITNLADKLNLINSSMSKGSVEIEKNVEIVNKLSIESTSLKNSIRKIIEITQGNIKK